MESSALPEAQSSVRGEPRNSCNSQELRGRFQSRRLPGHMARFASGRVEDLLLLPEHLAQRARCSGKRQKRTMLPQAKPAFGSDSGPEQASTAYVLLLTHVTRCVFGPRTTRHTRNPRNGQ